MLTRFRDGNFAAAEHFELIFVHHDDRVWINPDTQELRMRRDNWFQITFPMTFRNVLINCAIRYESKTALVAFRHHNFRTLWITPHQIGSQGAGSGGTAGDHSATLQYVS